MAAKTIVSASVVLYLNGRLYGQVKSFRWSPSTPQRELHGIDSVEPFDLAPQAASITGEVGVYRVRQDGGAQGVGAGTFFGTVPAARFFSLQLRERLTQSVIFEAKYCQVVSESWSAEVKGVVEGAIAFKGLNWKNEVGGFVDATLSTTGLNLPAIPSTLNLPNVPIFL